MLANDKWFCVRNNKSIDIVCSVLQKTLWLYTLGNRWQEPDSRILWEAVDHVIHLLFIMGTRTRSNASLCGCVKYHRKMLTFINHILIFLWDINFKFNRDTRKLILILGMNSNTKYFKYITQDHIIFVAFVSLSG